MIEFLQLTAPNVALEHVDLTVALWFGIGIIVGLVLTVASIAALAIECMTHEQAHL
ncbi:MAG: hypothetical protein JSV86_16240 [Gemmatimonadota bacterium]|nr:MAG: hypothetical protein JSV86_16240 [Gemmatimonadota bacterium]